MKLKELSQREKSILVGLYLSKFDIEGLKYLGFDNFAEAFNVIGLSMSVQPASVKNYRDEFDPLFPNKRKGWRNRVRRKYCMAMYDAFGNLNLSKFSALLKDIIYKDRDLDVLMEEISKDEDEQESSFAKRLITGQAAEQYFRDNFLIEELFNGYQIQDATKWGCGFDFKLVSEEKGNYLGVEVKGLNEIKGNIILTHKEHTIANLLKADYFIFVVKNFKEKPFHEIYQNPLSIMNFNRTENIITQVSWNTSI